MITSPSLNLKVNVDLLEVVGFLWARKSRGRSFSKLLRFKRKAPLLVICQLMLDLMQKASDLAIFFFSLALLFYMLFQQKYFLTHLFLPKVLLFANSRFSKVLSRAFCITFLIPFPSDLVSVIKFMFTGSSYFSVIPIHHNSKIV